MKRVIVKSVYDAFEYTMDHYYPFGLDEEYANRNDTYAVISIQDTHNDGFGIAFTKSHYCKAVLTLFVDDLIKESSGAVLFNENHARQILDFVAKHKDTVDTLLVHCYAGESRSAAVAAFIEELEFNTQKIRSAHRINDYIYNKLKEVHNHA